MLLLSLIFALTSPAAAQLAATPGEYLARMDADRDGRVSLAEYQAHLSRAFRDMDRDGDGVLIGDELPVRGARPVLLSEHHAALARAFRRQDRDGDGRLDARELAAPPR